MTKDQLAIIGFLHAHGPSRTSVILAHIPDMPPNQLAALWELGKIEPFWTDPWSRKKRLWWRFPTARDVAATLPAGMLRLHST